MKHKMYTLSREGDTVLEFDPAVESETKEAERHFELMTGEYKMAAFSGSPEETPTHIRRFDPSAKETVFVPHIIGGA